MADDKKPKPDLSFDGVTVALESNEAREHKKWRSSLRSPEAQADRGLASRVGPYKLNEQVQNRVVAGILLGLSLERAAAAANIHRVTLYRWFKAGAAGEEPYASFLAACREADAKCEADLLKTIKEASLGIRAEHKTSDGSVYSAQKQWAASAWVLERRFGYIAPKKPWEPDPTEQDAAAAQGVSLTDLVGAKAAVAANTGAEAPVDPEVRVRELEAQMVELKAELEQRRRAETGDADPLPTPGE